MRLFLHGKSTTTVLLHQLEQARIHQHEDPISTLWLSQWNLDTVQEDHHLFEIALYEFLLNLLGSSTTTTTTTTTCSKNASSSVGLLERVIVQNCHGTLPSRLWSMLLRKTKSLTIRYDSQQDQLRLPPPTLEDQSRTTTNHHDHRPLEALELEGVTLSEQTLTVLGQLLLATSVVESHGGLKRFSVTGHWTTKEVDHQHCSILGREYQVERHLPLFCQLLKTSILSPHFNSLELINCHLVDSCLAEILKHVLQYRPSPPPSQLEDLNLQGNMAKEKTLKVIGQYLQHPQCHLSHLNLGWQHSYSCPKYYHHHPHPHHRYHMDRFTGRMMEYLVEGIQGNQSLKTLCLARNQLCSSTSLPNLMRTLSQNRASRTTTLQYLDLQDCGLSQSDLQCILVALPQMRIRGLDLSGQQRVSGKKLKRALLESLSTNVYLCDIKLPHVESHSLEWLLEWNRIGRRAIVLGQDDDDNDSNHSTTVPPNLWPKLLERANIICRHHVTEETSTRHAASAIYHLLRQGGCNILSSRMDQAGDTIPFNHSPADRSCCQDESPSQHLKVVQSSPTSEHSPETTSIRHQIHDLTGEIELRLMLEESSSFEKPNTTAAKKSLRIVAPEPNRFLERPRLAATRCSPLSSAHFTTSTKAWDVE